MAVEQLEHRLQAMTASQDLTTLANDRLGALARGQRWTFFNTIERLILAAAEHAEHGQIPEAVDSVVAPFVGGDHLAIKAQQEIEFAPVEEHGTGERTGVN